LVDFNSEPFEEVQLEKIKVKVSRWALESDFLINLPVLKTHRQTKVSLGMKNLKGCLAIESKKMFHKHDIARLIALLNTKIKTSLTIIDGIYAKDRGPDFLGTSYRTNLLIAGRDVFSCDIVGAEAMGIRPEEVDYLKEFSSVEGRSLSLDAIEVKGEALKEIVRPLKWRLSVEELRIYLVAPAAKEYYRPSVVSSVRIIRVWLSTDWRSAWEGRPSRMKSLKRFLFLEIVLLQPIRI
jgi:uncharacterized protein (DUF362 family)